MPCNVPQPIIPCEAGAAGDYISGACPHVGHVLNGNLTKKFEGADNYVELDKSASGIKTEGAISISMWIKPTNAHTDRTAIFSHYDNSERAGVVVYVHDNKIGFGVRNNTSITAFMVQETKVEVVVPGEWHHIVAVWSPSTAPLVYIDGVKAPTNPPWVGTTIATWTDPDIPAWIGGGEAFNSTPQYFQGDISNVAYYVKAISAATVLAEYEAGCPANIADDKLNGYWPLDGNFTDISTGGDAIGDGTEFGSVPDEIDVTRPVAQIKQEELDISAVSATEAFYYTLWQDPVHETQYNYGARLDEITLHYTAVPPVPPVLPVSQIGNLAQEIASGYFFYLEGANLTTQISDASGWLTVSLGQLNDLIYTSYSGVNPNMGLEEESIYTQLYLQSYYASKATRVLRNIGNDADWTLITEGDTTIVTTNKHEVSRSYRGLAKDAEDMTNGLVASYHQYLAQPTQVAGTDAGTGVLVYAR
jgi:hypothetical protein